MKNKLNLFSLMMLFAFFTMAFVQDVPKPKAKIGTYQFIVHNTKLKYVYTDETFIYIEEQRKESEDITVKLNQFTEVFIPSKTNINSNSFQPLAEYLYK